MKKNILLLVCVLVPNVVWGQNCSTPPSCETLGFTKNMAACNGKTILRCPFDNSKVYCDDAAAATFPKAGDIYYSDRTYSSDVVAGKTPIGVVAYVQGDGGLILSLEEKTMKGNTGGNCVYIGGQTGNYALYEEAYSFDLNGYRNTKCLVNYNVAEAMYCNGYSTVGTLSGEWYLPAAGELMNMSFNNTQINAGLRKLSKAVLSNTSYLTSSAPKTNKYFCKVSFNNHSGQTICTNSGDSALRCITTF